MKNYLVQCWMKSGIPNASKATGPDGMSPSFYQKHWYLVGPDKCVVIRSMLQSGNMLRTHVTLIPKVKDPAEVIHLRPISLCNVIYKIIAKVLTNRLEYSSQYNFSVSECFYSRVTNLRQ